MLHLLDMFQHKSNIHMVLEVRCQQFSAPPLTVGATQLMYTDLERIVVARHVPLPLGDVQFYTLQLCRGVAFLHSQWVLHRDLKPSNVLASERGELRLADFGLARAFGGHARGAEPMTHQVVTRWYRAPELLFGARHYGGGIDTWAVGCIVAEMLLRGPLLAGESDIDQLAKTFQLLGTPNVDTWPDCEQLPDYVEFDARTPMPLVGWRALHAFGGVVERFLPLKDQLFAAAPADAVQLVQGCLQLDPSALQTRLCVGASCFFDAQWHFVCRGAMERRASAGQ